MSLETGKIYDGKVRNIAAYGAFVEVTLDEKTFVGMVHISEISNTYVNEIKDHLKEGQEVKVKVLSVDENGKTSLSIKKAIDSPPPKPRQQTQRFNNNNNNSNNNANSNNNSKTFNSNKPPQELSFEDMLNRFKQSSEERMSDLKRNMDGKRRSGSRRSK